MDKGGKVINLAEYKKKKLKEKLKILIRKSLGGQNAQGNETLER